MSNDSDIENEKWPTHVQKQWEKWSDENPKSSFVHVDTEELKRILTEDLTYASGMDVKEYTLYQKWCEVQEKFPTKINNTLWGDEEKVLVDEEQGKYINIAKNNIWIPQSPDDFMNLRPIMEYTDDSGETLTTGLDGSTVKNDKKRTKDLPVLWNTTRTFISTMKNNSNIMKVIYHG